ncbi:hypothetical protein RCG17_06770 [Neobacillus sp. PS3-12]|uniref:hypothetical protein n=1 Tax=Neobacillus sp. PS3-12 TaxID=3070677 RepID=UPI0027DFCDDB|nr:hypothetical protein [Neobacillus sp. PS3-12]WML54343.1 hypothetical protein RCG17_06770 [Neobacillus sp. PS3-12]
MNYSIKTKLLVTNLTEININIVHDYIQHIIGIPVEDHNFIKVGKVKSIYLEGEKIWAVLELNLQACNKIELSVKTIGISYLMDRRFKMYLKLVENAERNQKYRVAQ